MQKLCTEKELRGCIFSESKNSVLADSFEGKDFTVNCAVQTFLENSPIWSFWVDYSYNPIKQNLDNIPFLHAFIIQGFEEDRASVKDMEA
jgi:hypothetical protein